MWNLENVTEEPVCKAEIETQMSRTNAEKLGGGWWDELGDWD